MAGVCTAILHFKPSLVFAASAAALISTGFAGVIGTNVPATPVTAERVAGLPAWGTYLDESAVQHLADQAFIRAELAAHGLKQSTLPHKANNATGVSLDKSAGWYAGAKARRIADNLVSFQTPAGGWSKNTDFTRGARAPGELFGAENGSLHLGPDDFDRAKDESWNYVGTFDNDATTTELRFLAKVISAGLARPRRIAPRLRGGCAMSLPPSFPTAAGRRCGRCRAGIMTR